MYRVCAPADGLQWGRVSEDAEGRRHHNAVASGAVAFNGAASLRTRKEPPPVPESVALIYLQWGRVSEDAEGRLIREIQRRPLTGLQWGRVSEDAEGAQSAQGGGPHP